MLSSTTAPDASVNERTWRHGPRHLLWTLAWLRLCAVGGQALTVAFVAFWLDIQIPTSSLFGGIASHAMFAVFAFWRLTQPWRVTPIESVGHIAADTLELGYLLYLTGGATNPFVLLLVMPITFAAMALPLRHVAIVATLVVLTYFFVIAFNVPLPEIQERGAWYGFNLHLAGMTISFAITATMLGFFIARLAGALRVQQADAEHERERALRDEGILAIATQAASTAHELNTPLSTIRTLLSELGRDYAGDKQLSADIQLLAGQAERCRDILRELVTIGSNQLTGIAEKMSGSCFIESARNSFHLLRPEIHVACQVDDSLSTRTLHIVPALRHALINLLNNAADASLANGDDRVELDARNVNEVLELDIRDYGKGIVRTLQPTVGLRFQTTKRDGLGLGLALANATAERFGGTLTAQPARGSGTLQKLRIPLHSLENLAHVH
jgi:two-component system sensor histidine kinase RegB